MDLYSKPVKLRKYNTEPAILCLRNELKEATGIRPNTPERDDNPFEPPDLPGVMSRSWMSDVSPRLFDKQSESSSFRWSIDHLSSLCPVEINRQDILRTEYLKHVQTDSDENNAQESIRRFFERLDVHLPSPLTSQPASYEPAPGIQKRGKRRPEYSDGSSVEGRSEEFKKVRTSGIESSDASSQTDASVPADFDFEHFFADYKTSMQFEWTSLESVRRQLFPGRKVSSPGFDENSVEKASRDAENDSVMND